MSQTNANSATFMEKLSTFIVDKRNLIFLITIIGLIFSAFSRNWVQVENDLTFYLPDDFRPSRRWPSWTSSSSPTARRR